MRLIIVYILTNITCNLYGQDGQRFTINAEIKGLREGSYVYLFTAKDDAKGDEIFTLSDTIDRTVTKKERFTLAGRLKKGGKYYGVYIEENKRGLALIINPREKIILNGNVAAWPYINVTGSMGSLDYQRYIRVSDSLKKAGEIDVIKAFRKNWIYSNPNSVYAAFLILRSDSWTVDQKAEAYNNLTPEVKSSFFGQKLFAHVNHLKTNGVARIDDDSLRPGCMIPNFVIKDELGRIVSVLDEVKKYKYTLLDFWASWCKPCRAEIPTLKAVYEKYAPIGFNIIGISSDSKENSWRSALEQDKTNWLQGLDNLVNAGRNIFGIDAIPSLILIDNVGRIVSVKIPARKDIGPDLRGDSLAITVEALFSKLQ